MAKQLEGPTLCTYQGFSAFNVFLLCQVFLCKFISIKWLEGCSKLHEESSREVACGRSWGRSVWRKVTTGIESSVRQVGSQLQWLLSVNYCKSSAFKLIVGPTSRGVHVGSMCIEEKGEIFLVWRWQVCDLTGKDCRRYRRRFWLNWVK